jgi:hypothetical protein
VVAVACVGGGIVTLLSPEPYRTFSESVLSAMP